MVKTYLKSEPPVALAKVADRRSTAMQPLGNKPMLRISARIDDGRPSVRKTLPWQQRYKELREAILASLVVYPLSAAFDA